MAQDPDPAAAQAKFETYLRERMEKDFLPLTLQCYEQSAQPKGIGGRMVVRMVIVGDQTIGGVVESSEVDRDAGTLDDDWLSTCVKESLMAITFEPPPNGTRSVSVTYPFELRP